MKEKKTGQTFIRLLQGDITNCEVDAIVNAANGQLKMEKGLAKTVLQVGGNSIIEEVAQYAPIETGEAIVTTGGNLKAPYIIHVAGVDLNFKTNEGILKKAVKNILKRSFERNFKSIAIPAIGTGVGGFPIDECAEIMLQAIIQETSNSQLELERVIFALHDQKGYKAFESALEKIDDSII